MIHNVYFPPLESPFHPPPRRYPDPFPVFPATEAVACMVASSLNPGSPVHYRKHCLLPLWALNGYMNFEVLSRNRKGKSQEFPYLHDIGWYCVRVSWAHQCFDRGSPPVSLNRAPVIKSHREPTDLRERHIAILRRTENNRTPSKCFHCKRSPPLRWHC